MKAISKLGIICGSGDLPYLVLEAARKNNIPFVLVLIKGNAARSLKYRGENISASLGQVGTVAEKLKALDVSHICFAGSVRRPSIFSLKLDYLGKELLLKYFQNISGDNSLLSLIIKTYEERFGFIVISPQSLDKSILISEDINTLAKPNKEQLENIKLGFNIAKKIGSLDIGQSLVIQEHLIIAVEAVEGTSKLIKRSKKLLKKGASKGILIKVKKPNQEIRIDLPTIGFHTIKAVKKAGLAGIAIEKNASLVLNKKLILEYANANNIFVFTINSSILS